MMCIIPQAHWITHVSPVRLSHKLKKVSRIAIGAKLEQQGG